MSQFGKRLRETREGRGYAKLSEVPPALLAQYSAKVPAGTGVQVSEAKITELEQGGSALKSAPLDALYSLAQLYGLDYAALVRESRTG